MKKIFLLLMLSSTYFFISSCGNKKVEKDPPEELGYVLTWGDEFDGETIDAAKWDRPEGNRRNNSEGPDGWWDKEDSYLDGEGNLVIRVKQIDNRNDDNDPYDYSVGAIRSKGRFQQKFGKFEIRCQLPGQAGWWVAFWLYSPSVGNVNDSGEDGTEIDIFEGFGWTDRLNFALHWDGYGDDHKSENFKKTIDGIRDGFHTYTLEWTEEEYVFLVDNTIVWRTTAGGVSKVPAYVKVTGEISTENWAINEQWSNDPEFAEYPDYFIIDYVRVYQDKSLL